LYAERTWGKLHTELVRYLILSQETIQQGALRIWIPCCQSFIVMLNSVMSKWRWYKDLYRSKYVTPNICKTTLLCLKPTQLHRFYGRRNMIRYENAQMFYTSFILYGSRMDKPSMSCSQSHWKLKNDFTCTTSSICI